MLTREQISKAMQDRILMVVQTETGLTRPTLMKLRDNKGDVLKSVQISISNYLTTKPAD